MFFLRFRRQGAALRPFRTFFFTLILAGAAVRSARAADVSGQILDATGHVLPRVYVRVLGENGAPVTAVFTDDEGRFVIAIPGTSCRLEASLTGFQTATVPCAPEALRITLAVAPVSETVMVSATRTNAPTSQVGASATVYSGADLERLQKPLLADLLSASPGAMMIPNGGPGTVTSLFFRDGESNYNKIGRRYV